MEDVRHSTGKNTETFCPPPPLLKAACWSQAQTQTRAGAATRGNISSAHQRDVEVVDGAEFLADGEHIEQRLCRVLPGAVTGVDQRLAHHTCKHAGGGGRSHVCSRGRVRGRERSREREIVCVCACMCVYVCVCVCVYVCVCVCVSGERISPAASSTEPSRG